MTTQPHHPPNTPPDNPRETPPVNTPPTTATTESATEPVGTVEQSHRLHASALLERAADRLAGHGWQQGGYWPDSYVYAPYVEGDPCCALGALAVAAGLNTYQETTVALLTSRPGLALALAVDALTIEVNRDLRDGEWHAPDIADWNDDPARTAGEVIDAMRATARRLTACSGVPSAQDAHPGEPTQPHHQPSHQRSTSQEPTHD
ncbi:MAG TPA: hypothetical protein VE196_07155 [Pseudonocardiaceae bacterium]|nr:hypothetical protein [Pseudonocardiaceae bacterium]